MSLLSHFNLENYKQILTKLIESQYTFKTNCSLEQPILKRTCFLRHDIDLHLNKIELLSSIEYDLGIKATYFILLSANYNVLEFQNKRTIEKLIEQGHEIGLHYDLMLYPIADFNACKEKLNFEIDFLNHVFNINVRSIVMHQPHTGVEDIFKSDLDYYHPHNPIFNKDAVYISDSCRAWRDEKLLTCFTNKAPKYLQLNTHPELWLGQEKCRLNFLEHELMPNMTANVLNYKNEIIKIWQTHEGVILHDKRENKFNV